MFLSAFGDRHTEVDDLLAEGDRVVGRHTHYMTHTHEVWGMPATGKQLIVSGIDFFRLTGGQVVEWWVQDDSMAMLQQLGAIPAPE
jgi:predicted ester cyclase